MVTNNTIDVATGATGTILSGGGVGTAPTFTATPSVTSVTFGGTALSKYAEGTWTPTFRGSTVAGTTTYNQQYGYYTRIGNTVIAQLYLDGNSGGTASGVFQITSLPFTVKNQTLGFPAGAVYIGSSITWRASTTMIVLEPVINSTLAQFYCSGPATAGGSLLIQASTSYIFGGTLIYQI